MSAIRRLPDPDGYDSRPVLRAFEHRAANPSRIRPDGSMEGDGDLANLIRAQKARHDEQRFQWEREDRARENRARPWRLAWKVASHTPPIAWVALLVAFLVGCLWLKAEWEATVFAEVPREVWWVLFVAAVVAGLVWDSKRRTVAPAEVVQPEPVAPADMYRAQKVTTWQEMGSDMPSVEARAIFNALPAAKGKKYREVIIAGLLPVPAVTREQGKRVISAMMPSGLATPDDCDVRRLAAGLGVDDWEMVRLGPCTPTRLVVEVLDEAPSKMVAGAWPALGRRGSWYDEMPIGVDDVGRPVSLRLAEQRIVVAGASNSGKTSLMRMIVLWALGAPDDVEVHLVDLKGSPKLRALADRVAYCHMFEVTPDLVDHLRSLVDEMQRRYREGEDSWSKRILLLIDEAQDIKENPEAEQLLIKLARKGREAGIDIFPGSQSGDSSSLPPRVLDQCNVRLVMQVSDAGKRVMLGERAQEDTTSLRQGQGFLFNSLSGKKAQRIATYFVDDPDVPTHLAAIPALPPGMSVIVPPAGGDINAQDDDGDNGDPEASILDDIAAVMPDTGPGLPWDRLAELVDMPRKQLQAELAFYDIRSKKLRIPGHDGTVNGVSRADIDRALGRPNPIT